MEDDHKFFKNGRRPQVYQKRKTTPTFSKMVDNLNFFKNGRRPQLFQKRKTTSTFSKTEDDPNFCKTEEEEKNFKIEIATKQKTDLGLAKLSLLNH